MILLAIVITEEAISWLHPHVCTADASSQRCAESTFPYEPAYRELLLLKEAHHLVTLATWREIACLR